MIKVVPFAVADQIGFDAAYSITPLVGVAAVR